MLPFWVNTLKSSSLMYTWWMKPPFGTNGLGGTRLHDGLSNVFRTPYDDGTDIGVNVTSSKESSPFRNKDAVNERRKKNWRFLRKWDLISKIRFKCKLLNAIKINEILALIRNWHLVKSRTEERYCAMCTKNSGRIHIFHEIISLKCWSELC